MADNDQEEETEETETESPRNEMHQCIPMHVDLKPRKAKFKALHDKEFMKVKEELKKRCKKITSILNKCEADRSPEEIMILNESPDVVKDLQRRTEKRKMAKQRVLETEDEAFVLKNKCKLLAEALKKAKKVVVYTGAGISTAASIPDYRGPNGVWTLLQNGKSLKVQDLSDAEPTATHMSLTELYYHGYINQVVSQNCDGLHLRSGFPRQSLSEVHGNMYIELCKSCKPNREYVRLFDVTEKTALHRHKTGRFCHVCNEPLKDTIVHFGEKSAIKSPYRWKEAIKGADTCDMILCLGTSLKVLKKYSGLWCMDKKASKRPNIYIVNLQWTPKDRFSTLKINGKCDIVMKEVLRELGVPVPLYKRETDPIFGVATSLKDKERKSTTRKIITAPPNYRYSLQKRKRLRNKQCDNDVQIRNKNKKSLEVLNKKRNRRNNPHHFQGGRLQTSSQIMNGDVKEDSFIFGKEGSECNNDEELRNPKFESKAFSSQHRIKDDVHTFTDSSISQSLSYLYPLMRGLLEGQGTSDKLKQCLGNLLLASQPPSHVELMASVANELAVSSISNVSEGNAPGTSCSHTVASNNLGKKEVDTSSCSQQLLQCTKDELMQDSSASQKTLPEARKSCSNSNPLPRDLENLLTDIINASNFQLISDKCEISQDCCSTLNRHACDNLHIQTTEKFTGIDNRNCRKMMTRGQSKCTNLPYISLDHNYIKQEPANLSSSGETTDTASETSSLTDMQPTDNCEKKNCSTTQEPTPSSTVKMNFSAICEETLCTDNSSPGDSKRKALKSTPGWFGKGLNIRKRRKLSH